MALCESWQRAKVERTMLLNAWRLMEDEAMPSKILRNRDEGAIVHLGDVRAEGCRLPCHSDGVKQCQRKLRNLTTPPDIERAWD